MKTLHELAWSFPDNLIDEQLIDVELTTGDYVYCAVGHLFSECGIDKDTIVALSEEDQQSIAEYAGSCLGLSVEAINAIIAANDEGYLTGKERQLRVRQKLLELI